MKFAYITNYYFGSESRERIKWGCGENTNIKVWYYEETMYYPEI